MILIFIMLFIILVSRLFHLQIVNGESYLVDLSNSMNKPQLVAATRGRIFDKNGVLLAYNELAYSVKISDSGNYESKKVKNATINATINKAINIIESNGNKITNDFPITLDESGNYQYTVADTSLLKFLRDTYGKSTIADLSDEQRNATAQDVIDYLCGIYEVSDEYSPVNRLEIINLRRYMSANAYNRYMTFTIAYEASDKTVASILENAAELPGITVEEEYIRKYVDSVYTSNILGYTGTISAAEIADNEGYEANDVIGKTGIEQSLDTELRGVKGSKDIYVDTFGRITEVLSETPPETGNDVYLTIDINLQKKVYNAIEDKLVEILTSYITAGDANTGDKLISYKTDGTVDKISIPMKTVYFALIDNNIISTSKIAKRTTAVENEVADTFIARQASVVSEVTTELTDSPTVYGKLSEEMQAYIYYVFQDILKKNGIINMNNVDTTDTVYQNWEADSISLKEFLTYAIAQNWIDMSKLTTEQYSSLQEAYDSLLKYITAEIKSNSGFDKKIYKYLVKSGEITGRQVCMMLFDQGVLPQNDAEYASLNSGSMSPYNFMMAKIQTKQITPAQLAIEPCTGSAVITNPNTGDIMALVSYPGYDNNKLSGTVDSEYYNQLNSDKSNPLINGATSSQIAPGSVFKACSAVTGLEEGVISTGETINCSGSFELVTPSPKCWKLSGHGAENVSTAIRDSCNVFFYNVGYRLAMESGKYNSLKGTSTLQKYAEELGLATKAGIEIYEKEPQASNTNAIASAIGQGNHLYSALNLARYVSTISSSGTCHNMTLVDKITDSEGNLIKDNSAEIANKMDSVSGTTWNAVHTGMKMVIDNTIAFNGFPISVAGKSGTAQEKTTEPDHATFISYAPYDNPEVAMSVVIRNGYASGNVAALTATLYKIYYGLN